MGEWYHNICAASQCPKYAAEALFGDISSLLPMTIFQFYHAVTSISVHDVSEQIAACDLTMPICGNVRDKSRSECQHDCEPQQMVLPA